MPTTTTNFSFNKPLVNDPIDEDIWGGQLNDNWDSVDTLLNDLIPIGSLMPFAGTTSPNSRWLLCDGAAVNRTTFATLFALISTSYGVGDGSTTFNLPDYRGRAGAGLDNLGGASANRITDANADSLNNTGMGSETDAGSVGTTGSTSLTISQIPSHDHAINIRSGNANSGNLASSLAFGAAAGGGANLGSTLSPDATNANLITSTGGGAGHTHPGGSLAMTTGSNVQASIAEGRIIRAL